MSLTTGKIIGVNGNMVMAAVEGNIMQNEVAYIIKGKERLKSEIVRIGDGVAFLQVFESTKGLLIGDTIEFSGQLLSVQLGPGLLTKIYDGLQNPLPDIAKEFGFFLPRGVEKKPLDEERQWDFKPSVKKGDIVSAGYVVGHVPEGIFEHAIMIPFYFHDEYVIAEIAAAGKYSIKETICRIKDSRNKIYDISMTFHWPVKIPIKAYREKIVPVDPLVTQARIIDTFFPVAKGGTFCIPGPFGAGKTVLQHILSRYATADIIVVAACGERAGEVVELLREFPVLEDPRTGKTLMDRTIIICNTSSMPVAAREASVYTAV
ncbi:V-type ATP synthase subunit A, partial [candidate division KSB1 bacterium]|nr:V-type ATP synthase subunit A [candidate division KSB1 bacterium]